MWILNVVLIITAIIVVTAIVPGLSREKKETVLNAGCGIFVLPFYVLFITLAAAMYGAMLWLILGAIIQVIFAIAGAPQQVINGILSSNNFKSVAIISGIVGFFGSFFAWSENLKR
jgi:hypothetical protein